MTELKAHIARIAAGDAPGRHNEAQTCLPAVLLVLGALGWDGLDDRDVVPGFAVQGIKSTTAYRWRIGRAS